MPPKKQSAPKAMTQPEAQMKLRGSRAGHPGAPDMPKPKRTTTEVAAEKAKKEEERAAKAAARQVAIEKIAALEDRMMREDADNLQMGTSSITDNVGGIGLEKELLDQSVPNLEKVKMMKKTTKAKEPVVMTQEAKTNASKDNDDNKHIGTQKEHNKKTDRGQAATKKALPAVTDSKKGDKNTHQGPNGGGKKAETGEKKKKLRESVNEVRNTTNTPFIGQQTQNVSAMARPGLKRKAVSDNHLSDYVDTSNKQKRKNARTVSASSATSIQSSAASQGNSSIRTSIVPGTEGEDAEGHTQVLWGRNSVEVISDGDDILERKAAVAQERKSATYRTAKAQTAIKLTPVIGPVLGLAPRGARAGRGQAKKDDISTSNLPPHMHHAFRNRYVPLIKDFTTTLDPWANPTEDDIHAFIHRIWDFERQLDFSDELFVIIHKLTHDRLSAWRNTFAQMALQTLDAIFKDKNLHEPTERAAYVQWLLEKMGAGFLRSHFVLTVFATHYTSIVSIHPDNQSPGRPIGALVLTLQAIEHALNFTIDGIRKIPPGVAGHFSQKNWGDYISERDGKEIVKQRVGRYVKLLDGLAASQWVVIVRAAEALVTVPKPPATVYMRVDPIIPSSSDVEIIDEDTDNYGDDEDEAGKETSSQDDNDEQVRLESCKNMDEKTFNSDNEDENMADGGNELPRSSDEEMSHGSNEGLRAGDSDEDDNEDND